MLKLTVVIKAAHLNGAVPVEYHRRQLVQMGVHSEIVQDDDDHESKVEDEWDRGESEGQAQLCLGRAPERFIEMKCFQL